jgi:glycosyltransferase involved in cell wall biosynthesis
MRLLILLPFAPRLDATNGAARVITQFLTEITSRHKVAILYFREADEPGADRFFRDRCERVEEAVRPASNKSVRARLLRYLSLLFSPLRLRPLWVTDWSSRSFGKRAARLAREFQPDIIQAEFHVMGQYFSALEGISARRMLVEHEPSARAALYIQDLPSLVHKLIARVEKIAWQRYERALYRQVDAVVAFTEADKKSLQETAGRTPIRIIPPGIAIPEQPLNPLGSLPLSLLFVGNFYHSPNVDAARRLAGSIFPSVQKQIPQAKLFLVGENPPADLKQANNQNVIVTCRVPEITPYFDRAALLVAPLHLGGGMRIKVLESLAAGKAVVTTPLAAEGLDVLDSEQLIIAETDREFIDRIVYLLENPEERRALAYRARAWAREHIAWEASIAKYETLYKELLGESGRSKSTDKVSLHSWVKQI